MEGEETVTHAIFLFWEFGSLLAGKYSLSHIDIWQAMPWYFPLFTAEFSFCFYFEQNGKQIRRTVDFYGVQIAIYVF